MILLILSLIAKYQMLKHSLLNNTHISKRKIDNLLDNDSASSARG